ncbi:MAG: nicotinate-nucleotide adenylyltransferase [Paracoccaceae bacterium]
MTIGPDAPPGLRVGLLGGSFDPPHEGHVHITRWALRRFRLNRIWWLVSPGNPLKARGPAEMARRLAACRELIDDPRVEATDIELRLGTRYTADTLAGLKRLHPGVRFTWLMGADNLMEFHRWEDWRWIMETFPIGVFARPGSAAKARLAPAARRYRRFRLRTEDAGRLSHSRAPAWAILTGAMSDASSTEIRERGEWP